MRSNFSRLSTAIKMFLILGALLFPLGLVAVLASIDAARDGRSEREMSARASGTRSAAALDALITKDLLALRFVVASSAVGESGAASDSPCAVLRRAQASGAAVTFSRLTLFDREGRSLCAQGGGARLVRDASVEQGSAIRLDGAGRAVRISVEGDTTSALAVLELRLLQSVVSASARGSPIDVHLEENGKRLRIVDGYNARGLQRTIVTRARVSGSDVFVVASLGSVPISTVEVITILLPIVIWLAAALLGWLIVNRLLLRPIVAMQQAVLAYRPGSVPMRLPDSFTPATEIRDLGDAFARATATIAAHETELEEAIARQARLIREVHHRVKNNLQVVASLLNLHARGARSADAANAYATIQRRVDALAVVHRNHFAELEDDRGISLRSLLSELTGNLRATAPDSAGNMAITLDLDAAHVNQDVAVSVAFFVTEVVEHAMMCTPDEAVSVTLRQSASPSVARLILSAASLKGDAMCENVDTRQFERITTGLSRQLRAVLDRDTDAGVFSIDIAVQESQAD